MPSSSLVGVEVGVEVGVRVKMQFGFLTFSGGWLGWGGVVWFEKSDIKLISTQVEVGVELGKNAALRSVQAVDHLFFKS